MSLHCRRLVWKKREIYWSLRISTMKRQKHKTKIEKILRNLHQLIWFNQNTMENIVPLFFSLSIRIWSLLFVCFIQWYSDNLQQMTQLPLYTNEYQFGLSNWVGILNKIYHMTFFSYQLRTRSKRHAKKHNIDREGVRKILNIKIWIT